MRVPYAPSTPPSPSLSPIYSRIAARRAPRPLIPLDLALLHNPSIADGWNSFIGAIRTSTSLAPQIREVAISRVAVLNKATHEWDSHAALAIKAGVSRAGMQSVFSSELTPRGDAKVWEKGEEKGGLSGALWQVVAYTDQMSVGCEVDEGLSAALRSTLGDKGLVELTATVAAYNCVSRFLVALDVGERNGKEMKKVEDFEE